MFTTHRTRRSFEAESTQPRPRTSSNSASPLADALGRMVSVCESKFRSLRAPTVSLQLSLFGGERRGGGHERGGGCGYTDEVDMEEVVEESTHVFSSSSTSVTSYTHAKFTSTLQVLMPSPKVEPRRLLERSDSQEGGSALRSLNSGPTPAAHLSRAHEAERRFAPSPRIPRTTRIPSDILTGTSPPPRAPPPPTSPPTSSISSEDVAGRASAATASETPPPRSDPIGAGSRIRSLSFGSSGGVTPFQVLSLRKGLEEGQSRDAGQAGLTTGYEGQSSSSSSSATSSTFSSLPAQQKSHTRFRGDATGTHRPRLGADGTFSFSTVSLDRLLEDDGDGAGDARRTGAGSGDLIAPGRDRSISTGQLVSPKREAPVPRVDRSASGTDRTAPRSDRLSPSGDRSAAQNRFIPTSHRTAPAGDRPVPASDRLSPDSNGSAPGSARVTPGRDRFIPSSHRNSSASDQPTGRDRAVPARDRFIPTSQRTSSASDRPASATSDRPVPSNDRLSPGSNRSPPGNERLTPNEDRFIPTSQRSPLARDRPGPVSDRPTPARDLPVSVR
ncbi:nascent polypeptide-associated complex subunit alpha, muscle-specific form-like isoform X2 [Lethenteron reissneri]|uniref:nascent polypeptide-associated complex subunit alpha, muscle-specific form-like isoform X2 n=1 Tax=Lethenteron reissneri TaxID=7753 RepID=UPI002AB6B744|nr:nascent polypeptide-associated complex subunit alpha, muscle-specific form-like isoform X2 [Lethenteron reissneri]